MNKLIRSVFILACVAAALPGCKSTSSTEVGVRTNLFGIFERRGEQQAYSPGGSPGTLGTLRHNGFSLVLRVEA